jgi:uncharacterized delta-60 repeat protein
MVQAGISMAWSKRRRPRVRQYFSVIAVAAAVLTWAVAFAGAAGQLDTTFSGDGRVLANLAPGFDVAYGVAVQDDGKIVVAGRAGGAGGRMFVARYQSSGALDPTFSGDGRAFVDFGPGNDFAQDVAITADDKIVIAGAARDFAQVAVARFDTTGAPDTSFSGDGKLARNFDPADEGAYDVVVDGNGRIVLVGFVRSGGFRLALMRFMPNGGVDTSFSGDGLVATDFGAGQDFGIGLALQDDGKIVAAGIADETGGARMALARYLPGGRLDTSFSSDGRRTINTSPGYENLLSVAVQADGNIVAVGQSNHRIGLVRVTPSGPLDPSFSGDGIQITNLAGSADEYATEVAIQPDGALVISGMVGGAGGRMLAGRYLTNGSPDSSFAGDGFTHADFTARWDIAHGVALQADGNIVVAGSADGQTGAWGPDVDDNRKAALARFAGT